MPTKPATLPRWATDETNNSAPSSGQMDTGWTANQVAVSSYFNWLAFWTYKWIDWLDDIVPGASTLPVQITAAGTFTVTDDLTIDDLNCDTVTATGNIKTTGGEFKHDVDLKLIIPVSMTLSPEGAGHTRQANGGRWTLGDSTDRIIYPICLPIGSRITAYEIILEKNTTSAVTQAARLYKMHSDGTETALGTGATNNENSPAPGAMSVLGETGLTETLALDHQYYLRVTPSATSSSDFLGHALVFYDRP